MLDSSLVWFCMNMMKSQFQTWPFAPQVKINHTGTAARPEPEVSGAYLWGVNASLPPRFNKGHAFWGPYFLILSPNHSIHPFYKVRSILKGIRQNLVIVHQQLTIHSQILKSRENVLQAQFPFVLIIFEKLKERLCEQFILCLVNTGRGTKEKEVADLIKVGLGRYQCWARLRHQVCQKLESIFWGKCCFCILF